MGTNSFPTNRQKLWVLLAIAAVLIATPVTLHLEGRPWICTCGVVSLWSGQVCSANNSQHFLDPYSFTHILHGFLFVWLLALIARRLHTSWQFWLAMTFESLWEILENSDFIINRYRTGTAALGYNGDSVVNSLGDIVCCAAGVLVARKLGVRRSLAAFLVLELALLIWIRDSLVLEIIMLVHPINALKAWQMCQ